LPQKATQKAYLIHIQHEGLAGHCRQQSGGACCSSEGIFIVLFALLLTGTPASAGKKRKLGQE
jgi:hypothetical protein